MTPVAAIHTTTDPAKNRPIPGSRRSRSARIGPMPAARAAREPRPRTAAPTMPVSASAGTYTASMAVVPVAWTSTPTPSVARMNPSEPNARACRTGHGPARVAHGPGVDERGEAGRPGRKDGHDERGPGHRRLEREERRGGRGPQARDEERRTHVAQAVGDQAPRRRADDRHQRRHGREQPDDREPDALLLEQHGRVCGPAADGAEQDHVDDGRPGQRAADLGAGSRDDARAVCRRGPGRSAVRRSPPRSPPRAPGRASGAPTRGP